MHLYHWMWKNFLNYNFLFKISLFSKVILYVHWVVAKIWTSYTCFYETLIHLTSNRSVIGGIGCSYILKSFYLCVSALLEAARKINFRDISSQIADGFSSRRYYYPLMTRTLGVFWYSYICHVLIPAQDFSWHSFSLFWVGAKAI